MADGRTLRAVPAGLVCVLLAVIAVDTKTAADIPTLGGAPVSSVFGLAGKRTELPCDITPQPGDSVLIVLWYRDGSETPVFSYDLRNRMESRRRWSNRTVFSDRADFVPQRRPAVLTLQPSVRSDTAQYRCRVDYQFSRTRYALVNLTVIAPPESVEITTGRGLVADTVVGAYKEGQKLRLTCWVRGGYPRPRVIWRSAKTVLSTDSHLQGDDVISDYVIDSLTRGDLHRMLTCSATNTNLTAPTTKTVMIDMNFAPLHVIVLGDQKSFSAGRQYQLVCQCSGSRPPAGITWYIGGVRVSSDPETKTSHSGNITMSTLSFTPEVKDDRSLLLCRCQNPKVEPGTLEYSSRLNVHYLPQVGITLSNFLDPEKIREGGDVVFECHVRSNPPVYKKEWRHNNRPLEHSKLDGIIISNYSLALQSVQRRDAGVYMCVGFNSEGEGESNSIFLDVKYAPVCRPGLQRIYGVAKRELANVVCDVEANPAEVRFRWTFNNTSETRRLQDSTVNSTSTRSVLHYRPRTEMDYGTVVCSASNNVGDMVSACVFHILAAGPPDPLFNCTIQNSTSTGLLVTCLAGFNGGVAQNFLLNVFADVGNRQVYSQSAAAPRWWVDGLPSGRRYRVQAVAENAKGRSSAVVLDGSTRPAPPSRHQTTQDFTIAEMQPEPAPAPMLLATLVGVLGSLALLALASVVACLACRRRQHQNQRPPLAKPLATQLEEREEGANDSDDRGPDVVPEPDNEVSYEVYRIAGCTRGVTAGIGDTSDGGETYMSLGNGGIPLRTLNHIVPPSPPQGATAAGMPAMADMTSSHPVSGMAPPLRPPPAVYATVDRRRGPGAAVSRLAVSERRPSLLAAGGDGHSSL